MRSLFLRPRQCPGWGQCRPGTPRPRAGRPLSKGISNPSNTRQGPAVKLERCDRTPPYLTRLSSGDSLLLPTKPESSREEKWRGGVGTSGYAELSARTNPVKLLPRKTTRALPSQAGLNHCFPGLGRDSLRQLPGKWGLVRGFRRCGGGGLLHFGAPPAGRPVCCTCSG